MSYELTAINNMTRSTAIPHLTLLAYDSEQIYQPQCIHVLVHCHCSRHTDPTLLHISLKHHNEAFISHTFAIYVPDTNMPIKYHL